MVEQIKIAITTDEGLVIKSMVLFDGYRARIEPTKENIENEINRRGYKFVKSWRIIKDEDMPQDRSYRNAWEDKGDKIDHDMSKAREIHKEKLRVLRQPLLDSLDVQYMKADEEGDQQKKKSIIKEKQRLRDITALPEIENAQTIEELKNITL